MFGDQIESAKDTSWNVQEKRAPALGGALWSEKRLNLSPMIWSLAAMIIVFLLCEPVISKAGEINVRFLDLDAEEIQSMPVGDPSKYVPCSEVDLLSTNTLILIAKDNRVAGIRFKTVSIEELPAVHGAPCDGSLACFGGRVESALEALPNLRGSSPHSFGIAWPLTRGGNWRLIWFGYDRVFQVLPSEFRSELVKPAELSEAEWSQALVMATKTAGMLSGHMEWQVARPQVPCNSVNISVNSPKSKAKDTSAIPCLRILDENHGRAAPTGK